VGDSFVETLEIHVHVETPETFNVTLVDLPGLLAPAPGSDGPATVERIVNKYVNMSGSLLLLIVLRSRAGVRSCVSSARHGARRISDAKPSSTSLHERRTPHLGRQAVPAAGTGYRYETAAGSACPRV
jgi:hypothetical protein